MRHLSITKTYNLFKGSLSKSKFKYFCLNGGGFLLYIS